MDILSSQWFLQLSTIIIFVLSLLLAAMLTVKYAKTKSKSHLFWSLGLWCFTIGALLEIIFAFGIYSDALMAAYLFIVAILVEFLALGSLYLLKNRKFVRYYSIFFAASAVFTLYSVAMPGIKNMLLNYVVEGPPPLIVTLASSIATFPAAIILIVVAAMGYRKRHSNKLLSIITGVVVVSVAGTLYIASFPSFLYYSEFIGIVLLWLGFI